MTKKIILVAVVTSSLLNAIDYGAVVGSIKTPEAIKAVSKGTNVTVKDVTDSVDTAKLAGAVMGTSTTSKTAGNVSTAAKTVENIQKAKKAKDTVDKVQTGVAVGKALKLF